MNNWNPSTTRKVWDTTTVPNLDNFQDWDENSICFENSICQNNVEDLRFEIKDALVSNLNENHDGILYSKTLKNLIENQQKYHEKSNKPILLRRNNNNHIKSSGYGLVPPRKLDFKPKLNKSCSTKLMKNEIKSILNLPRSSLETTTKLPALWNEPKCLYLPKHIDHVAKVFESEMPLCSSVSRDGRNFIFGTSKGTLLKMMGSITNISMKKGKSFDPNLTKLNTHDKAVNYVSHSSPSDHSAVLSCSDDNSIKMTDMNNRREGTLLHIKSKSSNVGKRWNKMNDKNIFKSPFIYSSFHFINRFILGANGNRLLLFDYQISEPNDVQRYESRCKYCTILDFTFEDSKRITACTNINNQLSEYAIIASSNDLLRIFDLHEGKVKGSHNVPSGLTYQLSFKNDNNHDIVLSNTMNLGLSVYDFRGYAKPIANFYDDAISRVYKCHAIWSLCGNYIYKGTENGKIMTFDIRNPNNNYPMEISGLRRTYAITSLALHPQYANRIIGTNMNGEIFCTN
ncbi:hypothetical protein SNEBB_002337 [Seison nebaliae]|nr:hypothetical protein SNEBB_002337 [Seison nebaliae]